MKTEQAHLILGLTGGIGRATALALSKRNIPIKALVRNKSKALKYTEGIDNVDLLTGDASDSDDLAVAFEGVSTVYYCVNIPYPQWDNLAISLLSKCVDAAVSYKTKLVFPGNVYVYGHAKYNPVDEKHPHAAHTKKGGIRMEMEEMLYLAKKNKGLDYTIIRMPDFYGPFVVNTFSEQLYINAIKGKTLRWIGDLDIETELIFIEDGGEAMVLAGLSDKSSGEVFNIPAVHVTTARKYLGEIVKLAGSSSKLSTLNSDFIFKIAGLFNSTIREVLEMLYLKREKLILKGSKFEERIAPLPATSYESGIKKTLAWTKDYYGLK
jgi:nucleoside-diphosphate-sugar epimerase